jgi:hypothetical protein
MTGLILMLAVAAAMALFREPLGRGLVRFVETVDRKRLMMLVVLLFLVWALLHQIQIVAGPISGDSLVALFDTSTYAALFDATTYADLAIGLAAALLNQRTRQWLSRMVDLARLALHPVRRGAARARRTQAKPRHRPSDGDEPEPRSIGGVLAFA